MRRRLIELCLLAYPAASRRRDREYLRDLALELSAEQGTARQLLSLTGGGVRARWARRRGSRARSIAEASVAVAAAVVVVVAVAGLPALRAATPAAGQEVERYVCRTTAGGGACAGGARGLAAHRRAGWRCTASAGSAVSAAAPAGSGETSSAEWRCVRATGGAS